MTRPLVVVAPSPILTITAEASDEIDHEIHLHAGGQGFWVARMASLLGADVRMCSALGGESGAVLRALIQRENVPLAAVESATANGVYIHLRSGGARHEIARTNSGQLSRHETDELYGVIFSAALDAGVVMLSGTQPEHVIESDVYRRLAADLRRNRVRVVADLSGRALESALRGGLDLLKISDEELVAAGLAGVGEPGDLLAAGHALHDKGAETVLISRAEQPALVLDGPAGRWTALRGPRVEAVEPRGAGDSMFAALGATLARDEEMDHALRVAVAAGCLNATRRGLGTGTREEIGRLSAHVEVEELPSTITAGRSSAARP
jgi:1-phosphofructokinase